MVLTKQLNYTNYHQSFPDAQVISLASGFSIFIYSNSNLITPTEYISETRTSLEH